MSRDVFPAVAMQLVELEKALFLLSVPGLLVDCRVEVVVPPLATLLARPCP